MQNTLRAFFSIVLWAVVLPSAYAQLSQNSGINSADTWATFDLQITTQASSSSINRPTITQSYHTEIGYDGNGQIILNLWPTGAQGIASDVGVVRLSGGKLTVFDQNGLLIPDSAPFSNVPAFNPLGLLGNNPGASILSQLVVSNMSAQATNTNSQLSYSGPQALLSKVLSSGSAQWTYAQSGNIWVATQATFSVTQPSVSATRTLQFSNVYWSNNSTNDATRANHGSTALNPPGRTTSIPPTITPSSSSDCPPASLNNSGLQNVVFQHGIFSDGCAWRRMVPWLNQYFRWGTELVPSLNSLDNIANQGTALTNVINSAGGSGYILVGHSQGGLVSRYAAQQYQLANPNQNTARAVLAIDTPHQGAPLAGFAQGAVQQILQEDLDSLWGNVGCSSPFDNILCYLIAVQYSGFSDPINLGALTDLAPGSSFLTNLNNFSENFQQAAVIGNTPTRFIEVRVADNKVFSSSNPEDPLGERNVTAIYGIIYDVVQISWLIAELDCIFYGDPIACAVADYLLPIWVGMDVIDLDYILVSSGGNPEDGLVPSDSQRYPSAAALQYSINHADSHSGALKSELDRSALEQILAAPPFNVPTQGSCGFSISPASYSVPANGGNGTISLSTGAGCQWSAISQASWITVTSGTSGTSSGNVAFSAVANPQSVPRVGAVHVGNGNATAIFTVNQAGICTYMLWESSSSQQDPIVDAYPSSGGTSTITVYADPGCAWSAASNASWLTIASGGSGTGTGSFTYVAAQNSGGTPVTGGITVMGHTVTVILGGFDEGIGSFTITGGEQYLNYQTDDPCFDSTYMWFCPQYYQGWDNGNVFLSVGNFGVYYGFGQNDTPDSIASALANAVNNAPDAPVTTIVYGNGTVVLFAKQTGFNANYSFSVSVDDSSLPYWYSYGPFWYPWGPPSFGVTKSGSTLTGGQ